MIENIDSMVPKHDDKEEERPTEEKRDEIADMMQVEQELFTNPWKTTSENPYRDPNIPEV